MPQEKKFLDAILRSMIEGFVVHDETGKIIKFNQAALRILRLSEDQLLGKTPHDPMWKTVRENLTEYPAEEHPAVKTIRTGVTLKDQIMGIKTKDQKITWISINSTPISEDVEDVIKTYALVTFHDITRLENIIKEFIYFKQTFNSAQKAAKIGNWSYEFASGKIVWSEQMYEIFPQKIEEGEPSFEQHLSTIHPDDQNYWKSVVEKCSKDGLPYTMLFRTVHNKNKIVWVEAKGAGFFSEKAEILGLSGTCQDVTDKVEQETELRRTKNLLQATLDHMPGPVYSKDGNGRFVFVNKKFYDVVNTNGRSAIGLTNFDIFPKDVAIILEKHDKEIINTQKSMHFHENVPHPDGSIRNYDTFKFPVYDDKGEVYSATGVSIDITEKIKVEEELEKQRKIISHNAKLASIGELAAGVGHEINNPLAILMGHITVLGKEIDNKNIDPDKLKKSLLKMNLAADRIKNIVLGLRTFARADDESKTNVDISSLLQETYNLLIEIFEKEGIKLSLNLTAKQVLVFGNPGRLQQLFMNLLTNARDATQNRDARLIGIDVLVENQKAVVKITDNGTGIPKNIQAKIYEPFFTTKDVNKGTGIGLALAHSTVMEHAGEIEFTTSEDGTTFKVSFPLSTKADSGKVTTTPKVKPSEDKVKGKILVVDDEEDLRAILSDILSFNGFSVELATNGEEAYERLNQDHFDVLISDMKMPKLDGLTLVNKLREGKRYENLKIFMITGGVSQEFEDQLNKIQNKIDGYFFKPFDEARIIDSLKKSLLKKS